jgi:hypothetical protein
MLIGKDLPVALIDDHGTLWVDNADGTATNTQDENDGRPDQGWEHVDAQTTAELHTALCRQAGLPPTCLGGPDCAETQRVLLLFDGLNL